MRIGRHGETPSGRVTAGVGCGVGPDATGAYLISTSAGVAQPGPVRGRPRPANGQNCRLILSGFRGRTPGVFTLFFVISAPESPSCKPPYDLPLLALHA